MNIVQTSNVIPLRINPIAQLKSIREQMKLLEASERAVKDQINNLLDAAGIEELVIDDDKVKRMLSERSLFDSKTFESLHPDLYTQFKKTSALITLRTM